jgi:cytochrome c2
VDGDVWKISGLQEAKGPVKWKRFASGLHEPMTCAIRDEQIFVFDRNGIWRLKDTNGDGEADVHELFANCFAQTADMREFPSTLRLAPNGEFIIAKGGQEATTLGKHNGSVLRISADGKKSTVLGYGFRQPNAGVNIRTGLVTSSDQEGQYVPSTPLHIVRDHQFYGFLGDKYPREQYPAPIADPLTWMPHAVNSSALSQVWLFDAKMGPLNDTMVQICFNKPELLRVMMNTRANKPQAAVVSITSAFDFPPLNGSVNPKDGELYLAGFQVIGWGNTLDTLAGLCRVRYTGEPSPLPREVVAMDKGVLMRFDVALDAKKAADPASYSLATWGYKRAYTYGSAQYKADGAPGIDWLTPSSAYVSEDCRSVFIGVPNMKPVMQLRVGWSLAGADGSAIENNAYTTPYELTPFDGKSEGFGSISVDLTPRAAAAQKSGPVTVEEGRRLSQVLGCVACHSTQDQDLFHIGPKWKGLFGSERTYVVEKKKEGKCMADEAYIRESILTPHAKTVKGYEKGEYAMPSYAGVVTDTQVESLILYIKSLK